jgi:mandelate racemase
MIAVAGLDMAAWDALAKAADLPLCVLLGGSVGPVNAYNSNGLWLQSPRPNASRLVWSPQCASSRIISTGLARARVSNCTLSACRVFCRRCSEVSSRAG